MPIDLGRLCQVCREHHLGNVGQVGFENVLNDIIHMRFTIRL